MSFHERTIDNLIAYARREQAALNELLSRYRGYLRAKAFSAMRGRLQRRCDESDIVQQTLTQAFQGFVDFQGSTEQEFSVWIEKIQARVLLDTFRRHIRAEKRTLLREVDLTHPSGGASLLLHHAADSEVLAGERALQVAQAIDSLPPQQREVARLRYFEGEEVASIADQLRKETQAISALLYRATKKLRETLALS